MQATNQSNKRQYYPGEILSIVAAIMTIIPPLSPITLTIGIIAITKIHKAKVVGWQKKFFAWYSIAIATVQVVFISLFLVSIFSGTACFENRALTQYPEPTAISCEKNITVYDFFDIFPTSYIW